MAHHKIVHIEDILKCNHGGKVNLDPTEDRKSLIHEALRIVTDDDLLNTATITGCPKVRCMQIIGELEQVGRGAYTEALGYIGDNGSLDLNILIRTMSCWRDRLVFRAGAGIVADSVAERELKETRAKALGLLRALGVSA